MRRRWIVAFVIGMCALPAAAQASEPHWQLVADPAPGSTGLDGTVEPGPHLSLTVANGTPFLAERGNKPNFELTVYRAVGNRFWRDLGDGPLNPPGFSNADLTSAGSSAWIAWDESGRIHVARLTRWDVQELPGSPIAGGVAPQIAWFGGRLYVAYSGSDGMHAVRTR